MKMVSYFIKNIPANRIMIMWSLGVSSIIGVLTVMALRITIPYDKMTMLRDAFSLAFAFVFGFSSSTSASAIVSSYAYQSRSFGFLFHRMGIKKINLLGSLISGMIIAFLINGIYLFLFLLILIKLKFGIWAVPVKITMNAPLIMLMSIIDGLIFTSISLLVVSIILISSKTKLITYARYFPLLLYIITFVIITNGIHGIGEYIFPYSSLFYVFNYLFSGSNIYYENVTHPVNPNLFLCTSSILVFLAFVIIILYLLVDHIYVRGGQAERQF